MFLVIFIVIKSESKNNVTRGYQVIRPTPKEKISTQINAIKKKFHNDQIFDDPYCSLDSADWYVIDINNDAKKEYVSVSHQGSGHFLVIYAFAFDGKNIPYEVPFAFELNHEFHNPLTWELELFIKAENQIYMRNDHNNIYSWTSYGVHSICNSFWVNEQRKLFNELYKAKRYQEAFTFLYYYEKRNRNQIDPIKDLWLRNDILLAAIKAEFYQEANEVIKSIKDELQIIKTSASFMKAFDYNQSLYRTGFEEDKKNGTRGKYNYDWLLEYKDSTKVSSESFSLRVNELLSAAVPNVPSISFGSIVDHFSSVEFKFYDNRFVVITGYNWSQQTKGLFWCDLKNKISAFAYEESELDYGQEPKYIISERRLYIMSRSMLATELSQDFLIALKAWLRDKGISPHIQFFYDWHGTKTEITSSLTQEIKWLPEITDQTLADSWECWKKNFTALKPEITHSDFKKAIETGHYRLIDVQGLYGCWAGIGRLWKYREANTPEEIFPLNDRPRGEKDLTSVRYFMTTQDEISPIVIAWEQSPYKLSFSGFQILDGVHRLIAARLLGSKIKVLFVEL